MHTWFPFLLTTILPPPPFSSSLLSVATTMYDTFLQHLEGRGSDAYQTALPDIILWKYYFLLVNKGEKCNVTTWAVNSEQRSLGKKKSVLWFQIVLLFVAETNKVCWNQAFITSQPFSASCKNSLSLFWAKNGIIIREASKKNVSF